MSKAIKVRDISLSDGLLKFPANLLDSSFIQSVLPLYPEAGFYIVEALNPAIANRIISDGGENPLQRLDCFAKTLSPGTMTAIQIRSRNIFGRMPLPSEIQSAFLNMVHADGINIIRVEDMLNDTENIDRTLSLCKARELAVDAAICYAVEPPRQPTIEKKKTFLSKIFKVEKEEPEPVEIFSDQYYTAKARHFENAGARVVTLDDTEGLLTSSRLFTLMPRLKHAVKCDVAFHPNSTFRHGLANALTAIIKGVDIIDANMWWMACGNSAPALELIWMFCEKMGIGLDVDMEDVGRIRRRFKELIDRAGISEEITLPGDFEALAADMPRKIRDAFDTAIDAAGINDEANLDRACHEIEEYFGFKCVANPHAIPGQSADISAFIRSTLAKLQMEALYDDAVDLISKVRQDAGEPPMTGNIGKIIAGQAVAIAIDRYRNAPDYSNRTDEFHALIKGLYGKTTLDIEPDIRERITGTTEEAPFTDEQYKAPANPIIEELGGVPLAGSDSERLLLHLFQQDAPAYLRSQKCSNSGLADDSAAE